MKSLKPIISVFTMSLTFSLMGCSYTSESSSKRALFETRAEAEKAAKDFNCTGAHQMGNEWMPCEDHNAHKEANKHDGHHHQH
tara:strand:- start:95 stop:343 length:249 start_codon:yes stop_codon:yes gene_type:complete